MQSRPHNNTIHSVPAEFYSLLKLQMAPSAHDVIMEGVACRRNVPTNSIFTPVEYPGLLTLSTHAQQGLQYLVCVSVCVSICVSVTQHLTFNMIICATNGTNRMKVKNFKRFTLKMFRCEARAFPVGTAT